LKAEYCYQKIQSKLALVLKRSPEKKDKLMQNKITKNKSIFTSRKNKQFY
jgi:hypothetical protein